MMIYINYYLKKNVVYVTGTINNITQRTEEK